MTKLTYNYDPNSGAYIGQSEADPSPLESGVYLIPAFATEDAPPDFDDNHVPVFQNGVWILKEVVVQQIPSGIAVAAQLALEKSDITVLRCVENHIEIPAAWVEYRKTLRDVMRNGEGAIPARPPYPDGT